MDDDLSAWAMPSYGHWTAELMMGIRELSQMTVAETDLTAVALHIREILEICFDLSMRGLAPGDDEGDFLMRFLIGVEHLQRHVNPLLSSATVRQFVED